MNLFRAQVFYIYEVTKIVVIYKNKYFMLVAF